MKYKNILQIDDDCDDCDFFKEALYEISNAVYTSLNNPVEALRKLINKEIEPDIIFLDINMPVMSGLELFEEIKKSKEIESIPIIIFSTASLEYNEIFNKKLDLQNFYYTKPSNFNDLKTLLKKIL
jgi:NIMA (never in mitosis gene a)-related kinase